MTSWSKVGPETCACEPNAKRIPSRINQAVEKQHAALGLRNRLDPDDAARPREVAVQSIIVSHPVNARMTPVSTPWRHGSRRMPLPSGIRSPSALYGRPHNRDYCGRRRGRSACADRDRISRCPNRSGCGMYRISFRASVGVGHRRDDRNGMQSQQRKYGQAMIKDYSARKRFLVVTIFTITSQTSTVARRK